VQVCRRDDDVGLVHRAVGQADADRARVLSEDLRHRRRRVQRGALGLGDTGDGRDDLREAALWVEDPFVQIEVAHEVVQARCVEG
jgi:hypothetical protein